MTKIIMFHGAECPDCIRNMSYIEELKLDLDKKEVWHNEDNVKLRSTFKNLFDSNGQNIEEVPSYVDVDRKKVICDPKSKEELEAWLK